MKLYHGEENIMQARFSFHVKHEIYSHPFADKIDHGEYLIFRIPCRAFFHLNVDKQAINGPWQPGGTGFYQLTVTNNGDAIDPGYAGGTVNNCAEVTGPGSIEPEVRERLICARPSRGAMMTFYEVSNKWRCGYENFDSGIISCCLRPGWPMLAIRFQAWMCRRSRFPAVFTRPKTIAFNMEDALFTKA